MPKLTLSLDSDEVAPDAVEELPVTEAATQRWLLAIEGSPTGDGRTFEDNAFTWRELPLPFMATDVTGEGHDGAKLVAKLVNIERVGSSIYGYTENIASDDPDVLRLQKLMTEGDLLGVSVDLDDIAGEMIYAVPSEEDAAPSEDGDMRIAIGGNAERLVFSKARIMGATAVPFPAFAEARQASAVLIAGAGRMFCALTADAAEDRRTVEDAIGDDPEALEAFVRLLAEIGVDAAEDVSEADDVEVEEAAITAAVEPPDAPPAAWFADPQIEDPFPGIRVTDDGRVYGYLALWDTCHVGFQDQCVMAPRSAIDYAAFRSGEIITAEGGRIAVGTITTGSGHAPLNASTLRAKEHYDHTGWGAADVACGENGHGIWLAGAVRSGQSSAELREFMAAKVSGDWRRVEGNLELIAVASVNSPGFPTVRASLVAGAVSALVAAPDGGCAPAERSPGSQAAAERVAATIGRHPAQRQAQRDELASKIGRDPFQRRLALAVRVKGTN